MKGRLIVGHVPRKISAVCYLFLRRSGTISCEVTDRRRYSADLPQGGLEIPCKLIFVGVAKDISKVQKLERSAPSSNHDSATEQPAKRQKMETPVSCNNPLNADPAQASWLQLDGNTLSQFDKNELCEGKQLNDNHINYAQALLKKQFPSLEGLQLTLLQNKRPKKKVARGLQVIHSRNNHWIVASTLDCRNNEVKVFDSLYSSVDEETQATILNLFEINGQLKLNILNLQKQRGGSDCGLFAVAVATALAFGVDPTAVNFQQNEMRGHLSNCFQEGLMTVFPTSS